MDPNLQNPQCRGASGGLNNTSWPDFFQKLSGLFGDLWRPIVLDGIWKYIQKLAPETNSQKHLKSRPGVKTQQRKRIIFLPSSGAKMLLVSGRVVHELSES